VLTGGVLVALLWLSPLLMPNFVVSSEDEFGPLGTVFVVMLWLTIVCSIVVFCGVAGHLAATEPRLARLLRLAAHRGAAAAEVAGIGGAAIKAQAATRTDAAAAAAAAAGAAGAAGRRKDQWRNTAPGS
jgi:hypothetical protein